MMCSLVTNNCGETRYIGIAFRRWTHDGLLIGHRIFFRLFYLLAQRYTVGEWEDRGHLLPRHDIILSRGREQMDVLEARGFR